MNAEDRALVELVCSVRALEGTPVSAPLPSPGSRPVDGSRRVLPVKQVAGPREARVVAAARALVAMLTREKCPPEVEEWIRRHEEERSKRA